MIEHTDSKGFEQLTHRSEERPDGLRRLAAPRLGLWPRVVLPWLPAVLLAFGPGQSPAAAASIEFDLARSTAVVNANCLTDAKAHVTVTSQGQGEAEMMKVQVSGAPPHTTFDAFVIQVPNAPFGMSWYQGDVQTDGKGRGMAIFRGRFNIETFVVAPNTAPAPVTHDELPFPDASSNPATAPVHMYHVGLWFDSPTAAEAAGCPATVTPFNGDHTAGIQAMSTKQFPADQGPLLQLQ